MLRHIFRCCSCRVEAVGLWSWINWDVLAGGSQPRRNFPRVFAKEEGIRVGAVPKSAQSTRWLHYQHDVSNHRQNRMLEQRTDGALRLTLLSHLVERPVEAERKYFHSFPRAWLTYVLACFAWGMLWECHAAWIFLFILIWERSSQGVRLHWKEKLITRIRVHSGAIDKRNLDINYCTRLEKLNENPRSFWECFFSPSWSYVVDLL